LRPCLLFKTKKAMVSEKKRREGDEYRFGLKNLRCSICHVDLPGLTKQLSPAARSKGIISVGSTVLSEAEVRISVDGYLDQKRAMKILNTVSKREAAHGKEGVDPCYGKSRPS